MIVLEEGHLGIDARAFPFLIREVRRVYKELKFRKNTAEAALTSMATSRVEEQLQLTACLLLFNPDHSTVWADRRRALLESPVEENTKWNGEIRFLNLLMTQHTKAPSSWAHRKYVLNRILELPSTTSLNEKENDVFTLVQNEFTICSKISEKYPRNYYAWTHRIYLLDKLASVRADIIENSRYFELLKSEWNYSVNWLETHLGDHSAGHYAIHVFSKQIKKIDTQQDEKAKEIDESTIISALACAKGFTTRYPGHEALWMFRRGIASVSLRSNLSRKNHQLVLEDLESDFNQALLSKNNQPVHLWTYLLWTLAEVMATMSCSEDDAAKSKYLEWNQRARRALKVDDRVGHFMWQEDESILMVL